MASSRLGEPSTARSHSLLNAIISASNWSRPRRCSTRPFSYKRLIGSARIALPRDAETSLTNIMFVSRPPRWCTRSAACLTTSVAMSPPKLTSTTTSSASKSSWQRTTASPHCAGLPVVVRSASSAIIEQCRGDDPDFIIAAGRIDADSDLLDHIFRHVIKDQPIILEQRVHGIEDHSALQLLPAEPSAFVKLLDLFQEVCRQMTGIVVSAAGCDPDIVHRHQSFHEWRGAWCGGDENARPIAEPQAQHHGIEYALLITHARDLVDDHYFRFRPAQRFRLFAREKHAHCAIGPFQSSPRRHPTRPWITAAGREYTALAFDVDIVKVGRGWGDEVNAL